MNSLNRIARLTGLGYLIIFITGFFSNFFVLENLVVPGDAAATASNIMANEMLFRYGIAGFFVMVLVDLLLAWTLYILFKPVNEKLSLLSAWLRLVNAAIFGLALNNLLRVLNLINNNGLSEMFTGNQRNAQIMLSLIDFNYTWLIGLVFFGIHLLFLGYLVYKSNYVSKIIGAFLMIAGAGYLVDSFANFMIPNYEAYKDVFQMVVMVPGIVGEFSLTLWLLIKGVKKN